MSRPDEKYNLVTFAFDPAGSRDPDSDDYVPGKDTSDAQGEPPTVRRIYLKLEPDWVMAPGVQPQVNRALILYTEFDKLDGKVGRRGNVEFWYTHHPEEDEAEPDHQIKDQLIVHVEVLRWGQVAGSDDVRGIEYRLYFADFREWYVEPRGGRLRDGLVNPEPLPEGVDLLQNSKLMERCLKAMNSTATPPGAVDVTPPMRDLQWFGAHAPTELDKLLEHTQAVFCPQSDATAIIAIKGEGNDPEIPPDRLVFDAPLPRADRRGRTVVFISEPQPVIETWTLTHSVPGDMPEWEYVVQDANGEWRPIEQVLPNAQQHVREGFVNAPAQLREQLRAQAYRCIRLKPEFRDPKLSPILRVAYVQPASSQGADHAETRDVLVAAPIAYQGATAWYNSAIPILVQVQMLDAQAGVLVLQQRLGRIGVGSAAPDPDMVFVPLELSEIAVQFSIEASKEGRKEYFMCAFRRGVDGIEDVSDKAEQLLDEPKGDVVVVPAYWMRAIRLHNGTAPTGIVNEQQLKDEAMAIAERVLAESSQYRVVTAKGFLKGELNGRVTQIRWDQEALLTEFTIDQWWSPWGSRAAAERIRKERQARSRLERQHTKGLQSGASGSVQPRVPMSPGSSSTTRSAVFPVRVEKDGGQQGTRNAPATWTYTLRHLGSEEPIAQNKPQMRPRPKGTASPQEGINGLGLAYYDHNGEIQLWDAGEIYGTGGCD